MSLHPAVLPTGLAFIMFSLGLGLTLDDFRRVARTPLAVGAGLMAQVVVLPALAAVIAMGLSLPAEHAIGLMILAACPGGVTAGIITRLARGDTALSISLTAITSVMAFVSVPLVVGLALHSWAAPNSDQALQGVVLPVSTMVGGLIVVTLLPVLAGMLARSRGVPASVRQWVDRAATAVFALIVVGTFLSQWSLMSAAGGRLLLATLALNLATMGCGALLGRMASLDRAGRVALAAECGMQNSALGITLALSMLAQPRLAMASVVYALVMNVSALAMIVWSRCNR